jgi:hypothetical protein
MGDRSNEGGGWSLFSELGSSGFGSAGAAAPATAPAPAQDWTFGGAGQSPPRRSLGKIAAAVVVVLALAAASFLYLSLNKSTTRTALAFSMTPGSSVRYQVHLKAVGTLTLQGRSVPFTMDVSETLTENVESVDARGVATVKVRVDGITGKIEGQPIPSVAGVQSTIKMARDGRILTAGGFAPAGGNSFSNLPGADQFTPLLPDHSVKPGDTWTKSFTQAFPYGSGSLTYSSVNTLERYETAGGVRAAVIKSTMSVPLDLTVDLRKVFALSGQDRLIPSGADPTILYSGKVSTTQTAWFDPKMGQMVKSSSQGNFDFAMRFRGFPASMGPPRGQIAFEGTLSVNVDRA